MSGAFPFVNVRNDRRRGPIAQRGFDVSYLPSSLSKDGGPGGPLRHLAADESLTPLARTLEREKRQSVLDALAALNAREQRILRLRFGFDGGRDLTLQEIGKKLRLSRERVRQIARDALAKIAAFQAASGALVSEAGGS